MHDVTGFQGQGAVAHRDFWPELTEFQGLSDRLGGLRGLGFRVTGLGFRV